MTYRPTKAIVYLNRLRHNFRVLQEQAGKNRIIFAMVKADAYGHGALAVAQALMQEGVREFGVATLDEALALREAGFSQNLMVLDGLHGPLKVYAQNHLVPLIHDFHEIEILKNQSEPGMEIALKVDTGMGRLGFFVNDFQKVLLKIKDLGLSLKSVWTHLARADEGLAFVENQYQAFQNVRQILEELEFAKVPLSFHNSAATLDADIKDFDWYRPGLALYGAYPSLRQKTEKILQPVLEWKTQIISLKNFSKGSPIGYGGTFVTERKARIAILPIGYADGYLRLFSNRGEVLVRGKRAKVVGRVSMDLTAIDVTDIPEVRYRDDVTLIGQDGSDCILADELAGWAKTISYEIFCNISKRVPRIWQD